MGVIFISIDPDYEEYKKNLGSPNNLKCEVFCIEEGYDLGKYISGRNNCLDDSICSCQCGYNTAENYENVKYEEPIDIFWDPSTTDVCELFCREYYSNRMRSSGLDIPPCINYCLSGIYPDGRRFQEELRKDWECYTNEDEIEVCA